MMAFPYPSSNTNTNTILNRRRTPLHSIQTEQSTATVETPSRYERGRNRATTDLGQPVTVTFIDRHAGPAPGLPQHAPPHIVPLASTTEESAHSKEIQHTPPPVSYEHTPSNPIPIPSRKRSPSRPTTPLTARVEQGNFFPSNYYITPRKSHIPGLRRGENQGERQFQSGRSEDTEQSPTLAHFSPARSINMRRGQTTSMYTPTSPLSPTMPAPPVPSTHQAHAKNRRTAPAANLRLASLPRFHPANFPSNDFPSSSVTSPRSSRQPSSQFPPRPLSEAQIQLQQYQRDLITKTSRTAQVVLSPTLEMKPNPPRLHPLGSPGPVTPMMLEGQGDYMTAGARGSNNNPGTVRDEREMVEKMIQQENERRNYPGREERISPAVSPAGGRG